MCESHVCGCAGGITEVEHQAAAKPQQHGELASALVGSGETP
jgi:hypothetical protein